MTEADWSTCMDPMRMLPFILGRATARKARLVSCGLCHLLWDYLVDNRSRQAVESAERYADGLIGRTELDRAYSAAGHAKGGQASKSVYYTTRGNPWHAAEGILRMIIGAQNNEVSRTWSQMLLRKAPNLLRCIFGNPWNPIAVPANWCSWNDNTVRKIAQAIYEERAFDRMPILADALEDAGCDAADILRHCREPGEHVRGCWVIDLLLGKE